MIKIKNDMKGITFVPRNPVSEESKKKLDDLMKKKEEGIKKTIEDYKNGKLKIDKIIEM